MKALLLATVLGAVALATGVEGDGETIGLRPSVGECLKYEFKFFIGGRKPDERHHLRTGMEAEVRPRV